MTAAGPRLWPPLGRGWLSYGKRNTQSLLEALYARGRHWSAADFCMASAMHKTF